MNTKFFVVGAIAVAIVAGRQWRRRSRCATYAGVTDILVRPLKLVEANCNVVLTHSEKAAHA
jgi:hypothetical protein